ncbi:MAG TPA: hypothetical protein VFZ09_51520 [Archangium sp.]|uniref:hypothetical protein n=1 Tax=Archangium sp. TaxID=1872627 RepID=UPI002E31062B|nr:hypothetical protein [Archangium sp.]HEX5754719.1 hypothetical protein [Archangium sp.]
MARTEHRGAWLITLALLLAAGCVLRFHELGHDGLWTDELFTSSMVRQHPLKWGHSSFRRVSVFEVTPGDSFWTAKGGEQSPPLYELLTKAVVTVLGSSEFSLRLVSALAGCLWLIYLARRAMKAREPFMRRAYLCTLVISAVSVALIEYSQECRAYGLGALFTGILADRWLERWRTGFAQAELPGYGELGLFILGCHTHYNATVFCALLLGSYGVAALHTKRYRALARLALVPLACVPWLVLNAHTILLTSKGGVRWREFGVQEALRGALQCVLELPGTWVLLLGGAALLLAAGRRLFGRSTEGAGVWRTLLALLVLSTVYASLIGFVTMRAGMLHPRYYLYLLPTVYLGTGLLLAAAFSRVSIVAIPLALLVASSVTDVRSYYAKERNGYREVTRWLRTHGDASSALLYTWAPNLSVYRYYLETFFGPDADERAIPISGVQEGPEVCERLGDAPRVLVIAHYTHRPFAAAALEACGTRYQHTGELEYREVVGQVWTRRPPSVAQ